MPKLPDHPPDLSVQIPTRGRPEKLAACVRALAHQTLDPTGREGRYEVLVGLDGPDEHAARAARDAWGSRPAQSLRLLDFPRTGHLPIRNALIAHTSAPLVVFMNDDVVAQPGFLAAHLHAHRAAQDVPATLAPSRSQGVMVVGHAPWSVPSQDTLFDQLVRHTSLIFFYDRMNAALADPARPPESSPHHDWGFRHFWTLNASAPRDAILAVGGLTAIPDTYGHEDIELAFRLHHRFNMPVLYRPDAIATHDHRYTPRDVMAREIKLGIASWRFARASPAFALALFGRDITTAAELTYSRDFIAREQSAVDRLAEDFEALARLPVRLESPTPSPPLLPILARQFLLLKRHLWRRGLLTASRETHA